MFRRFIPVLIGLLAFSPLVQAADAALPLCPGTSKLISANRLLQSALKAAYPSAREKRGKAHGALSLPCLFPYRAVSLDAGVVLITFAQVPGEACHGCPAHVSAVFLRRDGNLLTPAGRHDTFVETGTFGDLISVDPLRLGSEEGLVIESGGTFQGYTSSMIMPFLIRHGRMEPIGPADGIPFGDSDCGAGANKEGCRDVSGTWQAKSTQLHIRYSGGRADGSKVDGTVVYELAGDALVLVSGADLAAEMMENRP